MKITAQVDFKNVSSLDENDENSLIGVLKNFNEMVSSVDENIEINVVGAKMESAGDDFGSVNSEFVFDTEDLASDDDEDDDEDNQEAIEGKVHSILNEVLSDVCDKEDVEYDVCDVEIE